MLTATHREVGINAFPKFITLHFLTKPLYGNNAYGIVNLVENSCTSSVPSLCWTCLSLMKCAFWCKPRAYGLVNCSVQRYRYAVALQNDGTPDKSCRIRVAVLMLLQSIHRQETLFKVCQLPKQNETFALYSHRVTYSVSVGGPCLVASSLCTMWTRYLVTVTLITEGRQYTAAAQLLPTYV